MANVYAALLLLAFEGVLMYAVFAWVEQRFTRWAFRSQLAG
jgi:NitT/TauT family transport system permease protein